MTGLVGPEQMGPMWQDDHGRQNAFVQAFPTELSSSSSVSHGTADAAENVSDVEQADLGFCPTRPKEPEHVDRVEEVRARR